MSNEAKQKVIQDAYGEHWNKVKDFVDENGWVKWKVINHGVTNNLHPEHNFNLEYEFYQTKNNYGDGRFEWRPKSLQGIESNNGWFKIEDGLPGKTIDCHFIVSNTIFCGYYNGSNGFRANNIFYLSTEVDYWQPIIVPPKPLY